MSRHELNREDLLRDAVALIQRVELQLPESSETTVVGFRRNGAASLFFGSEFVMQFNTRCELRRGYWQSRQLVAEQARLVALTRHRTSNEVQLLRNVLGDEEQAHFLRLASGKLDHLSKSLNHQRFRLIGQVPQDGDVIRQVKTWLRDMPSGIRIANRPNLL